MTRFFDNLYNRWLLRRYAVEYATYPTINGRLMIAFFSATRGHFRLGRDVVINSGVKWNPVGGLRTVLLIKGDDALIEIGDETGISNAIICARQHVAIGRQVNLGAGCRIFDTDFHSMNLEQRLADTHIPSKPVRIGDGAFIGAGALIMKGVTVGERSVIGAQALVAKDVPPDEIWGGNPARFIRKL